MLWKSCKFPQLGLPLHGRGASHFIGRDQPTSTYPIYGLFARLISHQPAVLFSQNEPTTSNQPQPASSTLLSEQTSTSHQRPANRTGCYSYSKPHFLNYIMKICMSLVPSYRYYRAFMSKLLYIAKMLLQIEATKRNGWPYPYCSRSLSLSIISATMSLSPCRFPPPLSITKGVLIMHVSRVRM
jgi:hypothetical protein